MQERGNLLDILRKTKKAIKDEDTALIKELSNRTIHSASIYQDSDNITIAVIVYSLGKILERKRYRAFSKWSIFFKEIKKDLDIAIKALEKANEDEFRKSLQGIRKSMNRLSGHLKTYIQEVFRKSKISKASRIYEHGISMEQTAKILGITEFELAEYAGQTKISDVGVSITKSVKERIKDAEEIFK